MRTEDVRSETLDRSHGPHPPHGSLQGGGTLVRVDVQVEGVGYAINWLTGLPLYDV